MAAETISSAVRPRKVPTGVTVAAILLFIFAAYMLAAAFIATIVSVQPEGDLISIWNFIIPGLLVWTGCMLFTRKRSDIHTAPTVVIFLACAIGVLAIIMNISMILTLIPVLFILFRWGGYPAALYLVSLLGSTAIYTSIGNGFTIPLVILLMLLTAVILLLVFSRHYFTEHQTPVFPFMKLRGYRLSSDSIKIPKGILAAGILIFFLVAIDIITLIIFFVSGRIVSVSILSIIVFLPRTILFMTTGIFVLKSRYGAFIAASVLMILNLSYIILPWIEKGVSLTQILPVPIMLSVLVLLLANKRSFHSPEKRSGKA